MNILIFAPAMPQALATDLALAGHRASLVYAGNPSRAGSADSPAWSDESAVRALAAQADVVVYQLGEDERLHACARAWMARLPGIAWLDGCNVVEAAQRFGPQALGILAPAGSDIDALLPCCPGPVLGADARQAAGALLRLGRAAQLAQPVRAAADAMAAILRGWGADDGTVHACGLADGFDLFES